MENIVFVIFVFKSVIVNIPNKVVWVFIFTFMPSFSTHMWMIVLKNWLWHKIVVRYSFVSDCLLKPSKLQNFCQQNKFLISNSKRDDWNEIICHFRMKLCQVRNKNTKWWKVRSRSMSLSSGLDCRALQPLTTFKEGHQGWGIKTEST